jgi:hypothetical protein
MFSQFFNLPSLFIGVFYSVWSFRIVAKRASVFLFCLFEAPLTSCASPWRAGETRNGASPKYCHYYVTKLPVISYVRAVVITRLDFLFG